MKHLFYNLIILCFNFGFSQVTKDTSYTIHSEYNKQNKKFPFIEIVQPQQNIQVTEKYGIIYKNVLDRKIHLDAYLFDSKTILPAVILLHGGGWNSGDKSMMKPLAEEIASKGYHCFALEYRLADEAIYPAAIEDVITAINYLIDNANDYAIDTNNIAVLGCSSGGQMASLIGTKLNQNIKAIVNLDGILSFHHPQSKEGKLASKWLGGTFEEKPEVWKDASALSHVSKNTPPFLFINSQYERFHAGRDEMITKMKTFNIDTKIEMINDSPHTFWLFHPWFEKTTNYIVTFLDEKLKS